MLFKPEITEKVNPDLLERLWRKQGYPGILKYQTKYDLPIYKIKKSWGILNSFSLEILIRVATD